MGVLNFVLLILLIQGNSKRKEVCATIVYPGNQFAGEICMVFALIMFSKLNGDISF